MEKGKTPQVQSKMHWNKYIFLLQKHLKHIKFKMYINLSTVTNGKK